MGRPKGGPWAGQRVGLSQAKGSKGRSRPRGAKGDLELPRGRRSSAVLGALGVPMSGPKGRSRGMSKSWPRGGL